MVISKAVGARIKRVEDPRLITGRGTYTDDVRLAGTVYMAVLRSPYAHARIKRLDVSKARQMPGVLDVLTGEEVRQVCGPVPALPPLPMRTALMYPLAVGKVRFVGEGVVAVVAESRALARDALEAVEVEYEPLPPVVDPVQAVKRTSPPIHEELKSNVAFYQKSSVGEVDQAFAEADGTVRLRLVQQRLIPMAMEPRAVVAQYDPGTRILTVWNTTQNPHILRNALAQMLNHPENLIRVIAPDVGGGFGSKIDVYPEEALASLFAMRLCRPVKWTEDRRENFLGTIHGRGQIQEIEAAYKKDGTITAIRLRIWADLGAYCQLFTHVIPTLTPSMACGTYRYKNIAWELWGVYTNKTPTDAYRGAGRPEAAYVVERMVDAVAHRLGMDPAEVRRKNFIRPDEFPYSTPTGMVYDSGDYEKALNRVLELGQYRRWREEQKARLQRGDRKVLGIGMATFLEVCGFAPFIPETAEVRVEPSGRVTVLTGTHPHGQGDVTAFTQLVSDELQVPPENVVVLHGDTMVVPKGMGTYGSRTLSVGGTAVLMAARKVKEQAIQVASLLLKVPPEKVRLSGGKFVVEDIPDKSVTWAQVAGSANMPPLDFPTEVPPLVATAEFRPENFNFPFGAHLCVVEVDRETGQVGILAYYGVDDCGVRINPLLVEGQLHGGIVQGIAQALYEGVVYDENGQLLTGTLMDYAVPNAQMVPRFTLEAQVTPTPTNPLGAKGVGELGTIGATPTVVNAVADAVAQLGGDPTWVQEMPLKPEYVWRLLQRAVRRARR